MLLPTKQIPSFRGLPIIGNLLAYRRDEIGLYQRMHQVCGDISVTRLGNISLVMVFSPQYIATILVDRDYEALEKAPPLRRFLKPLIGRGLLAADHTSHRQQRKLVAPAFQHRRIAHYTTIMAEHAEQVQRTWSDGAEIDIADAMLQITLAVVGKTLFDADVGSEATQLREALVSVQRCTNRRLSALIPLSDIWPTPTNREFHHAVARLDATIYHILETRRRQQHDRGDLLSMLLQAQDESGQGMSDQQVRDEAMTLFIAGYETTANALTWTWYLLTQHPEIYERVCEEVDRVLAGRGPTSDDLPNLPYTLQVLKESLRLYPPVHVIGRQVVEPFNLDGYHFSKGTLIGISMYVVHRNPMYFPNPERFDPDRWTPKFEAMLPRGVYIPFSTGPRNCVGNHFAMMEAQLVLTTLAQRVTFDLLPGQTIEAEPLITLRPKHGIKMRVHRRGVDL